MAIFYRRDTEKSIIYAINVRFKENNFRFRERDGKK